MFDFVLNTPLIATSLILSPNNKTPRQSNANKKRSRSNNRDDFANLSFILKVPVFSETYSEPSRTSVMKLFTEIKKPSS